MELPIKKNKKKILLDPGYISPEFYKMCVSVVRGIHLEG